jgi:hypothetical protein
VSTSHPLTANRRARSAPVVRPSLGHSTLVADPAFSFVHLVEVYHDNCVDHRYQLFVEAGGYQTREWWTHEGWRWLTRGTVAMNVGHHETTDVGEKNTRIAPRYWRHGSPGEAGSEWRQRIFDYEVNLAPHEPVVHVSWYEAMAYCRWAGRRCVDGIMQVLTDVCFIGASSAPFPL